MFHSLEEIFGLILFSKGAPVAAFSAGLSDGTASIMNGKIKNSGELKALAEDLKERKASCLLAIHDTLYNSYHIFFHKGELVASLYRTVAIVEDIPFEEIVPKGSFNLLALPPKQGQTTLEIPVDTEVSRRLTKKELEYIKEAFVDQVGPVGKLLWKKVLKSMNKGELDISEENVKDLIYKLAREIPDEEYRNEFLNRLRRWIA